MPEHCAAYSCSNRRTIANKARGITFHKFPKDTGVRKTWEKALRRKGFTASRSTVLCSQHFKQGDFDRTGQIVRLRDGVIPSVFCFTVRLQRLNKCRTTATSRRAAESLPVASQAPPETAPSHPKPPPNDDHGYALPASPNALKTRLNEALARVESLERERKNAKAREKRAKTTVRPQCYHLVALANNGGLVIPTLGTVKKVLRAAERVIRRDSTRQAPKRSTVRHIVREKVGT